MSRDTRGGGRNGCWESPHRLDFRQPPLAVRRDAPEQHLGRRAQVDPLPAMVLQVRLGQIFGEIEIGGSVRTPRLERAKSSGAVSVLTAGIAKLVLTQRALSVTQRDIRVTQ
jgi:hypothetical protein